MQTKGQLQVTILTSELLMEQLASFERQHHMSSAEFYERYRAGKLGDAAEYFRWAGLCYMALTDGVELPATTKA